MNKYFVSMVASYAGLIGWNRHSRMGLAAAHIGLGLATDELQETP